ncbi:translocation/assembly module TamB domain-containing protein [Legionella spiritensis]|uniref:translocation/assembly module TamB domain-containing protein n=1 Tax=Legionella spiritensis TaxID=452 RepID=UPI000F6FD507|nr:translocation/assembly module TamB domain-containing protein [Legionella spiritensis]VEG90596.1 periplasmic protein [Legionella spiritensis]
MRFLLKILKSSLYTLLVAFILLASILVFLLTSTPGLYLTVKTANAFLPGKIKISHATGRLIDHFTIKRLNYHDKNMDVTVEDLQITWPLKQLRHYKIIVERLQAGQLSIHYHPQNDSGKPLSSEPLSLPQLPVLLHVKQARIEDIRYTRDNATMRFHRVALSSQISGKQWQFKTLDFEMAGQSIHLSATMRPFFPYQAKGAVTLEPVANTSQALKGHITFGGDWTLYHWQGRFRDPVELTLHGTLQKGQELQSLIRWKRLHWPLGKKTFLNSDRGEINIRGKLPDVKITLHSTVQSPWPSTVDMNIAVNPQKLTANGTLDLPGHQVGFTTQYSDRSDPKIQGRITARSLQNNVRIPLIEKLHANLEFQGNTIKTLTAYGEISALYDKQPLKATLQYQPKRSTASIQLGPNHLNVQGSLSSAWEIEGVLPEPALLHPSLQGLSTSIGVNGRLLNPQDGRLTLKINKGQYQLPDLEPLSFAGGKLVVRLDKKQLLANGDFTIDPNKKAQLKILLPRFKLYQKDWQNQTVNGELSLLFNSLDFLEKLNPNLAQSSGQLQIRLLAGGQLMKPDIQGTMSLSKGRFSIPQLGITLNPVTMTLKSHDRKWTVSGSLFNGNHSLILKGHGEFSPRLTGSLQVEGQNFPIIQLEEYKVDMSPKLTLQFSPAPPTLTGEILISKANLTPRNFSSSATLSEDVVFAGEEPAQTTSFPISTNIRLVMGKDVKIAAKGLQGFVDGAIRILQAPGESWRATGELNVREGKYTAYGQDLTIDQGQLIFTGGLIDNPGIKVRAIRQFNNASASFSGSNQLFDFNTANLQSYDLASKTTVGIEVSGRLNSPRTHLFSIPSNLSQADILSMLLLGKPASQADKAGGQLLLAAISSLNLDSGTKGVQLLEQLKKSLGFDINLENNAQYNQQTNETTENTSLVLGKSLSKRLYLSYNLGFTQTGNNVFTAKYLLNKYFSIQVSASFVARGIDLLYTHKQETLNDF